MSFVIFCVTLFLAKVVFRIKKNIGTLTKDQILSATEITLRRFGVAKTSLTDIAKYLNVSHGTIYRHYKNKAELLEKVTEKWLDEKIIAPLTTIYKNESLNGSEALNVYIKKLINLKRSYAQHDKELFDMYTKVTKESSHLIDLHVNRMTSQMSEIVKRSDLKVSDPDQLAKSIFYATVRFHHPAHAYEWDDPSIDQEFLELWIILEKGFLTNKSRRKQ